MNYVRKPVGGTGLGLSQKVWEQVNLSHVTCILDKHLVVMVTYIAPLNHCLVIAEWSEKGEAMI